MSSTKSMRVKLLLGASALWLATAGLALGQQTGLIDAKRVYEQCRVFQEELAQLRAEVTTAGQKVKDKAQAIQPLAASAQAPGATAEQISTFAKVRAELDAEQRELADTFRRREAEYYLRTYQRLRAATAVVARRHGFSLVLRHNSEEPANNADTQKVAERLNGIVVFIEDGLDITDEVVRELESSE